jgi:hypothetical protein
MFKHQLEIYSFPAGICALGLVTAIILYLLNEGMKLRRWLGIE